jgi:hypothetical protein
VSIATGCHVCRTLKARDRTGLFHPLFPTSPRTSIFKMSRTPLLLLLLLSLLLLINQSLSSPPKRFVSLRLRAAWPSSSFAVEAAYAVAEFDAALFWSFVAGMSSNSAALFPDSEDPSPHLLYNASMSVASSLISATSLPLLAASLSLRRLNPRVTMLQVRYNPFVALIVWALLNCCCARASTPHAACPCVA